MLGISTVTAEIIPGNSKLAASVDNYIRVYRGVVPPDVCLRIAEAHEAKQAASGYCHATSALIDIKTDSENILPWFLHGAQSILETSELKCDYGRVNRYKIGEQYGWHHDIIPSDMDKERARVLSMVVVLKETPDFAGNGTEFKDIPVVNQRPGDLMVFHPLQLHRASPPTSGCRWTVSTWVYGAPRKEEW